MPGLFSRMFGRLIGKAGSALEQAKNRIATNVGGMVLQPPTTGRAGAMPPEPTEAEKKNQASLRRRMKDEARRRDPSYQFVFLGMPILRGIDFQSSNVEYVQYDQTTQTLFIEYGSGHKTDGRTYRYAPVSEFLAARAYQQSSKGIFVWDELRIRGTMLGHKVNYSLVAGGMLMPKWTRSAARIKYHEIQVGKESGSGGPHPVLQLGSFGAPDPIVAPYKAIGRFTI